MTEHNHQDDDFEFDEDFVLDETEFDDFLEGDGGLPDDVDDLPLPVQGSDADGMDSGFESFPSSVDIELEEDCDTLDEMWLGEAGPAPSSFTEQDDQSELVSFGARTEDVEASSDGVSFDGEPDDGFAADDELPIWQDDESAESLEATGPLGAGVGGASDAFEAGADAEAEADSAEELTFEAEAFQPSDVTLEGELLENGPLENGPLEISGEDFADPSASGAGDEDVFDDAWLEGDTADQELAIPEEFGAAGDVGIGADFVEPREVSDESGMEPAAEADLFSAHGGRGSGEEFYAGPSFTENSAVEWAGEEVDLGDFVEQDEPMPAAAETSGNAEDGDFDLLDDWMASETSPPAVGAEGVGVDESDVGGADWDLTVRDDSPESAPEPVAAPQTDLEIEPFVLVDQQDEADGEDAVDVAASAFGSGRGDMFFGDDQPASDSSSNEVPPPLPAAAEATGYEDPASFEETPEFAGATGEGLDTPMFVAGGDEQLEVSEEEPVGDLEEEFDPVYDGEVEVDSPDFFAEEGDVGPDYGDMEAVYLDDEEDDGGVHVVGAGEGGGRRRSRFVTYAGALAALCIVSVGTIAFLQPAWLGLTPEGQMVERTVLERPDLGLDPVAPDLGGAAGGDTAPTVARAGTIEEPGLGSADGSTGTATAATETEPGSSPTDGAGVAGATSSDGATDSGSDQGADPERGATDRGTAVAVGDDAPRTGGREQPLTPVTSQPRDGESSGGAGFDPAPRSPASPPEVTLPVLAVGDHLEIRGEDRVARPSSEATEATISAGMRAWAQLVNEAVFVGTVRKIDPQTVTLEVDTGEVTLSRTALVALVPLVEAETRQDVEIEHGYVEVAGRGTLLGRVMRNDSSDGVVLETDRSRVRIPRDELNHVGVRTPNGVVVVPDDDDWLHERALQRIVGRRGAGRGSSLDAARAAARPPAGR